MLRGDFSLEEIAGARLGLLQSRQNGRGEDRALASMLIEGFGGRLDCLVDFASGGLIERNA